MKLALPGLALALTVAAAEVRADYEVDESRIGTPAEALAALMAGNERFLTGETINHDFKRQIEKTAGGQAPYASVLSCLDSRIPPEVIFDQGIGDIFVGRVAGNVEDTHMLGSFEFAAEVMETKLLVVLGHTACGAVGGACADVKLGNLTQLLHDIQPAIGLAKTEHPQLEDVCLVDHIDHVAEANVRKTIADIRARSSVISAREESGQFRIVGAMYDVASGEVTWLDQPAIPVAHAGAPEGR